MNDIQKMILDNLGSKDMTFLNSLAGSTFRFNVEQGWYSDPQTGQRIERNIPEMLCLIHSEISEGLEGYRKGLMDDKLSHRPMLEVELADALIRILDLAGYCDLDLGGAFVEKFHFNANRADHKLSERAKDGGKAF